MIWLKVDNFKDFFDILDAAAMAFVHTNATTAPEYFLKEGFSVAMEGVFQNPDYAQQAVDIAKIYEIPCSTFQLKVRLAVLQQRDKVRPGVAQGCRKPLGNEVIAGIYTALEENPYPNAVVVDAEKMSVEECVSFIPNSLQ